MKLGLVAFANDSGLGAQTRRLAYMLKPDRLLVIDSSGFSKNKKQHFDWYSGFTGYKVKGFPTNQEVRKFMTGLTHLIVCENPLNFYMLTFGLQSNCKVYIQSNYEFCDHLREDLDLPEKFLMPSFWHVETMQKLFGKDKVQYLPPPINPNEFKQAREANFGRGEIASQYPRFLHIVGTLADHDRNGTLDLLESLKYSKSDFVLVIRSQHDLPPEYRVNDKRVAYQIGNISEAEEMYSDFDAMILPRRYGGLSLTTNEALMSGLPVIMSDTSPNNKLLPKKWLVPGKVAGEFMTRTMIDIFKTDSAKLGQKLDWLTEQDFDRMKSQAFEIGYDHFSESVLKPKYEALWSQ